METYSNSQSGENNDVPHGDIGCGKDCPSGGFILEDCELLHACTKTASMACESIKDLLDSLSDIPYADVLQKQLSSYECIYKLAVRGLESIGEEVEKISTMQKAMLWTGTRWNVMMDDSQTKIAEMLIEGTSMGVVEMGRALNKNKESASKSGVCICEKLLHDMSRFVDELKQLL